MTRRTKIFSLIAGFAALTAVVNVPAFGQTGSFNFVLVRNVGYSGHDVTITEYPQPANQPPDKQGTWSVGSGYAHYWLIDPDDWVEVRGPNGFDGKIAATDLPACFQISGDAVMKRVYSDCYTFGASPVTW